MDKELIKNNLFEYAEKKINSSDYDAFIWDSFKVRIHIDRIIPFVLSNEVKNSEITRILFLFIENINYTEDYFKINFSPEEIRELKIKLIEIFLVRFDFLKNEKRKEKSKIIYYKKREKFQKKKLQEKNNEKINEKSKEYHKEYYIKNKEYRKKHKEELEKMRMEYIKNKEKIDNQNINNFEEFKEAQKYLKYLN